MRRKYNDRAANAAQQWQQLVNAAFGQPMLHSSNGGAVQTMQHCGGAATVLEASWLTSLARSEGQVRETVGKAKCKR